MYGLNAVAFVFFIGINLLAYQLCKCSEAARKRAMTALCAALLSGNIIRYALVYPVIKGVFKIPVEFSTVAYFTVPAILLGARKSARSWAAYSGLMAGFFYYLAMIAVGGPIYGEWPPYDVYIAMLCHGALYICGLVTIKTEIYSVKDAPKLALGVAYVALRSVLLRPAIKGSEGLLIYILLDGTCVKRFMPQSIWSVALPVYYIAVIALVLLTIRVFFKRNQKHYHIWSAESVSAVTIK